MVTQKILGLHMIKSHGGADTTEKTVIKPAEVVEENTRGAVDEGQEPKAEVQEGMVEIVSADGRTLEVSIGGESWSGVKILVPADMKDEVIRVLEDGKFFLKN